MISPSNLIVTGTADVGLPRTRTATQSAGSTTSSTTYVQPSNLCGTAFVAPLSGEVKIDWAAFIQQNTAGGNVSASPAVRNGGSVGSGTVFDAADDFDAIRLDAAVANQFDRKGAHEYLVGLTAGNTYNVVIEFRVGNAAHTGTIDDQRVTVSPCL